MPTYCSFCAVKIDGVSTYHLLSVDVVADTIAHYCSSDCQLHKLLADRLDASDFDRVQAIIASVSL